jgi:PAS domain S-box-containing protein
MPIRAKRTLQRSSGQHVRFEKLLASLSTSFAGLPADEVEGALQQGLQQVAQWFGADRSTFAELALDGTYATFLHSYAVSGAPPFPPKTVLRQFSWLIETLRRGDVVCVPRLEDLPTEAREEREYMRRQGFKCHLSVPIFVGKSLIFALGLGSFTRERAWSSKDIRQLRLIGEILGNAVGRQRADEAAREGERRRRIFLETTISVPWEIDVETGRFTYIGPQVADLFGYPMEMWFEPSFWEQHLHPEDRAAAMATRRDLAERTDRYEMEYRMIDAQGRAVWLHDMVTVARPHGGSSTLRGFLMDITASKVAEDRLRDLSGRLISAQEEERRRIARDLHDDVNQRLALVATELERLSVEIGTNDPEHAARAQHTIKLINDIGTSVHALSISLHSAKLEHLGLSSALRALCRDLSRQKKLEVQFSENGQAASCRPDVALCLYRVAQEALQNICKHSGVAEARMSLTEGLDGIELAIEDDGKGFDIDLTAMKGRLGLVSMRERLRLVGGELVIQSSQSGTRVKARVPPVSGRFSGDGLASSVQGLPEP